MEATGSGDGHEGHPGRQFGRVRYARGVPLIKASRVTANSGVQKWTDTGTGKRL